VFYHVNSFLTYTPTHESQHALTRAAREVVLHLPFASDAEEFNNVFADVLFAQQSESDRKTARDEFFAILSTGQGEHQTVRQRAFFLCSAASHRVRQAKSKWRRARSDITQPLRGPPECMARPIQLIFQRVCLQRQLDQDEMVHLYNAISDGRADTPFMIEVFKTLSTGNTPLSPRFEAFLRAWIVCHMENPHFLGAGKNSTYNAKNQQALVHLYNRFCRADLRLHDEDNGIVWTNANATCGSGAGKTVQSSKPADVPLSDDVFAAIQRSGMTHSPRRLTEEARRASASEKKQQAVKRQDPKKQAEALHASAVRNQVAVEQLQEAASATKSETELQAQASRKRLANEGENPVRSAAKALSAAKRRKMAALPSHDDDDDDDDDDNNNNNDDVIVEDDFDDDE
jgi:hypothetical protein